MPLFNILDNHINKMVTKTNNMSKIREGRKLFLKDESERMGKVIPQNQ